MDTLTSTDIRTQSNTGTNTYISTQNITDTGTLTQALKLCQPSFTPCLTSACNLYIVSLPLVRSTASNSSTNLLAVSHPHMQTPNAHSSVSTTDLPPTKPRK